MARLGKKTETNRSLRFVMITTFYPPYHFGGDGNYVRQLAHILVAMGHTVDIIHDIDAFRILSTNKNPEPVEEPDGLSVFGLQSAIPFVSCLATQQLGTPLVHGRKIRKILDAGNYDVVHFHNISLVGGPGILSYGSDAVKLYTAHEHWLVCPTHILWRNKREVCTKRQCLPCLIKYRRPPQLWRYLGLLKRKIKHVDAFCSPSMFSANKHKEFGFEPKMHVMPSFLPDMPVGQGCDEKISIDSASRRRDFFLFVGRLEAIKGVQDLIPHFQNKAPADLLIVGAGEYESELKKMAGDSEHIHFLGWKSPEQIRILYKQAIAVLMPSVCYEVFPLVLLEALREGTPVVARALGPYPELVEKSRAGFLFDSEQELEQSIHCLATDRELRDRMGQAALDSYERYWSESRAMNDYFVLIKSIAESRGMNDLANAISE
jgi:glycosyltransferase involved in cell wall biosynthesis